jgi:hypothetical protein
VTERWKGLPELGEEPPAIVNILVHDGHLSADALPATTIDLAERGYVRLEEIGPGRVICRLPRHPPTTRLVPYERMVLDLLHDRAENGTVPAEALTTGMDDESSAWWERFRAGALSEARRAGLARRVNYSTAFLVAVAIFGIGAFIGVSQAPRESVVARFGVAFVLGIAALTALVGDSMWLDRARLTKRGRTAARRWRAARAAMSGGHFSDLPPPAVIVWDRYLGYAAALGLAHDACRGLPMGPDSTNHAWRYTPAGWQRVRVHYPRFARPGWGRRPVVAAVVGFIGALGSGALVASALDDRAWHPSPPFSDWVADRIRDGEPWIVGLALIAFAWFAWELGTAIYDLLTSPIEVEGRVAGRLIRRSGRWNPWSDLVPWRYYVAVDDGAASVIRSWRLRSGGLGSLRVGDRVHAVVTPALRHVRSMDRVS